MSRGEHGRFVVGNVPWTKGRSDLRLSPATEFKPGHAAHNHKQVGNVTTRTDKGGNRRAWVKLAEPNTWQPRAQLVWEVWRGPVPVGSVVHHINRDTMDDRIENLRCETRAEHMRQHKRDLAYAAVRRIEQRLLP